jgi:hypothetical protein
MFQKILQNSLALLNIWAVSFGVVSAQVPTPGKLPKRPVLIQNASIHVGNGKLIPQGEILLESGKIKSVSGAGLRAFSANELSQMEVIDAKGKHIYPGFILLNTPLGLNEIDAVRATLDLTETGKENPNVQAISAYNTDSEIIPTIRMNGILMAQITPRGSGVCGLSSVVQLDAWNWDDALVKKGDGLHIKWPSKYKKQGWWAEPGNIDGNKEFNTELDELETLFSDALMYQKASEKKMNTKLEGLNQVFSGKAKLYLHVDYAADIISAINFSKKFGISNLALVTGTQVLSVLDFIKTNNIPVILNRLHSLPDRPEDPVYSNVEVVKKLADANILFSIDYEGDMEIMGSRNLAFLAGSSTRFGIEKEQAVQIITLNAAKILGIDGHCGSLEAGKDATLFISDGDALDMKTQNVTNAWIQGRPMSLESKQTALYIKYKKMLEEGR